ncbi:MAG: hypothetical protein OHK0019_04780 [Saprospiraceae bacterium]
MKKMSFLLLAMCCAGSLAAQTHFGFKAGFNYATMPLSDDYSAVLELVESGELETTWLPGLHAGAVVEFGMGGNFGIGTGLLFHLKGGKREFRGVVLGTPYLITRNLNLMYLQVPLTLHFRSGGFYAGAGPYAGYAIGGTVKSKGTSAGSTSESKETLDFGKDENDDFSRLDYGVGFELGYDFLNSLRVSASYQLGLANILPADQVEAADDLGGNWSARNNVASISLSYFFSGN